MPAVAEPRSRARSRVVLAIAIVVSCTAYFNWNAEYFLHRLSGAPQRRRLPQTAPQTVPSAVPAVPEPVPAEVEIAAASARTPAAASPPTLLTARGLDELMGRISTALAPFQGRYLSRIAALQNRTDSDCKVEFGQIVPDTYLGGCPGGQCIGHETLEAALAACKALAECGGVTRTSGPRPYELRVSESPAKSLSGEASWPKRACGRTAPDAARVWEAFAAATSAALDDPPPRGVDRIPAPLVRADDSIFITISSYRDPNCAPTLARAFSRAARPEKVRVAVVQMNCAFDVGCKTGTGWGESRRWVDQQGPDPDCAREFCQGEGRAHCEAGRVSIVRLAEHQALGPFFTRFLAAQLWRGESFYLQVDSHTDFRQDWDLGLVQFIRRVPSYPRAVLSNYPRPGSPSDRSWPPLGAGETESPQGALCGGDMEPLPDSKVYTFRLKDRSHQRRAGMGSVPRPGCFVAAGFLFGPAAMLDAVHFDPYLPYIFHGEELSLSMRLWTSGFEIYSPPVDLVAHDYGRKSGSPKFWETVNMVFSHGPMHNSLTHMVMPRLQHVCGFPEAADASAISPQSLLTHVDTFGLGAARSAKAYLARMGIDMERKAQARPDWCMHPSTD